MILLTLIAVTVIAVVLAHYIYHRRVHLFYINCPWCRRDDFRKGIMREQLAQRTPEEFPNWIGVTNDAKENA